MEIYDIITRIFEKEIVHMKRILALTLVLVAVLSLFAGCTKPNTESNPSNPSKPTGNSVPPTSSIPAGTDPVDPWDEYEIITIAEAIAICQQTGETQTTEKYYVRGTVAEIWNDMYGNLNITDETGTLKIYGSYSADGSTRFDAMTDRPAVGDEVLLYGPLVNYKGNTPEMVDAWIIDYRTPKVEIDESEYKAMSIQDARNAVKGTKVKVTGVVARITYAFGQKPSGVMLVDGTNAIYVYDSALASRVKIGNEITILASKTYWILEDEMNNAQKFGYQGCNQLEGAVLVSNDEGNHAFDTAWITETTVKEIMDTPVSEDITTTIFKVTALVKKVDGNGFVNYYIDDLDGATGSYSYTQCSGADFAWLDEFDGKICTVYLTVLNAKSAASGCVWRFLPVAVKDEGFDVSTVNVAEHIVKYYGVPQFLAKYTGDPAMEVVTAVSSDLLKFTDAKLTYSSNNPDVVYFDGNVMHCGTTGTATITVTGTYNGVTYAEDVTITVEKNEDVTFGTVQDAINAELGQTVTVKGIVGPSLVNQDGFYLIDETGIIAVLTDKETLATLEVGYEVVLEGNRFFKSKSGGNWGNTCISDAKVLVNNYGSHNYSTESFDGKLTLAEFVALDVNTDYTTCVYTVTAKIEVVETAYYTNIKLVDGDVSVNLYCSSAKQYKWLQAYAGQTITMELAPCNWSSKSTYPACVLAVILEDGTKVLNTLNFD